MSSTAILAADSLPAPGVLLLSEAQAAQAAGVSRKTIRRLIEKGRLRASDYGTGTHHLFRIHPDDLARVEMLTPEEDAEAIRPRAPHRSRRRAASPASASTRIW